MTPTITWPTGKVDEVDKDKVDKDEVDKVEKMDKVDKMDNVDKVDKVNKVYNIEVGKDKVDMLVCPVVFLVVRLYVSTYKIFGLIFLHTKFLYHLPLPASHKSAHLIR